MHRIVLIVLAALFHIALSGQSKFHRGYPVKGSSGTDPDTSAVNLAGIQMKDGSYLSLDGIRAVADTNYSYLVLSALKPKGDVSTSKLIQMEGNTRILHGSVSLIQASNDSIYFTCTTTATTDNRLIACLDKSLDLAWTRVIDNSFDDKGSHVANLLDEGKDSLLYQLTQADKGDSLLLYFNQLNGGGTLLNNQKLSYNRINGLALPFEASHFEVNNDSSFVWTGSVRRTAAARSAAITILSKNRTPVFSKFYLPNGFQQAEGLKVIKVGKGYMVAGRYGNTFPLNQSFIFQTDSIGKIVWSKVFDAALSTRNVIDGLMSDKAGNIIVSGKIKLRDTLEAPFMLSLKQDGSQQWLVLYDRAKAHFNTNGGLFETQDMGYGYYQTDVDDEMTGKLKMGLIKTDYQGVTSCELKDSTALLKNQVFSVDTMATVMKAGNAISKEVNVQDRGFDGFEIPVLSLEDRKFCPGEPINVLYSPKPKGAVAWKWSDGSTKDTLRVFQTGEYSVTITIDDKYCYMLCDTSTLDYYDAPSALIGRGPQVCENTPYLLTVQAMGGKAGYTYVWNTQATTQTIQPSTTGTFSVTVTDACGQTARVNVTIGTDQWFGPPAVSVAKGPKVCKDSPFILSAAGAGGGGLYTFVWNTGETTASISNNKLGTYAVTVTDNCGKTGVASIVVDNSQWLGLPSVQLARGPQVCKDSTFLLSAQGAGGLAPYTYAWNSGKTTAIIEGTVLGTYTVTITDACDTFATSSIVVDASIWNPGPSVEIELSEENSYCRTGSIGLEAFATAFGNNNSIINYQWSAGNSNTNTTVVTAEGKYSVTVTDACKQTASAEFETGVLGVSCLKFPKIFFALDSAQVENKTFGAINQCGPDSSAVTDFVLKVFDRWGKEVFSADNIATRWDGKLENATGNSNNNEDKYPPDVYVWFTRYKVGAFCQYEGKGDVTVFR